MKMRMNYASGIPVNYHEPRMIPEGRRFLCNQFRRQEVVKIVQGYCHNIIWIFSEDINFSSVSYTIFRDVLIYISFSVCQGHGCLGGFMVKQQRIINTSGLYKTLKCCMPFTIDTFWKYIILLDGENMCDCAG